MPADHEKYMLIALEEAAKGGAKGNIAVGSIMVRGDTIVGRGHNLVTTSHDLTDHAETVAIRDACANLRSDDLSGTILYTTFQPCALCAGAIMIGNVQELVMGGRPGPEDNRWGDYTVEKIIEMCKWGDRLKVASPDVLGKECYDIRGVWEAKNKAKG